MKNSVSSWWANDRPVTSDLYVPREIARVNLNNGLSASVEYMDANGGTVSTYVENVCVSMTMPDYWGEEKVKKAHEGWKGPPDYQGRAGLRKLEEILTKNRSRLIGDKEHAENTLATVDNTLFKIEFLMRSPETPRDE